MDRGSVGSLLQIVRVPWLASVPVANLAMYKSVNALRAAYTPPEPVPPLLIAFNNTHSASTTTTSSSRSSSSSNSASLNSKPISNQEPGARIASLAGINAAIAAANARGSNMNMQKPGDAASAAVRVPYTPFPLRYAKKVSKPTDFWPVSTRETQKPPSTPSTPYPGENPMSYTMCYGRNPKNPEPYTPEDSWHSPLRLAKTVAKVTDVWSASTMGDPSSNSWPLKARRCHVYPPAVALFLKWPFCLCSSLVFFFSGAGVQDDQLSDWCCGHYHVQCQVSG